MYLLNFNYVLNKLISLPSPPLASCLLEGGLYFFCGDNHGQ